MARILDEYTFTPPAVGRPQNQPKYPYAEWFDGKIRELVQGEDFTVMAASIRTGLVQKAKRMAKAGELPPGKLVSEVRLSPNRQTKNRVVLQYVRD